MLALALAALVAVQTPCDDQVVTPPPAAPTTNFGTLFDVSRARMLVVDQGNPSAAVGPDDVVYEYVEDPATGSWSSTQALELGSSGLTRITSIDLDRNTGVVCEFANQATFDPGPHRAVILNREPASGTWSVGAPLGGGGALDAAVYGDDAVVLRFVNATAGVRVRLEHFRRTGGVWSLASSNTLFILGTSLATTAFDVQMDARFVAVGVGTASSNGGLYMFRFDAMGNLVSLGGQAPFPTGVGLGRGVSVALEDELCVVGAPVGSIIGGSPDAPGATVAYRYAPVLDRWVQAGVLSASSSDPGTRNGQSVALADGRVASSSRRTAAGSDGAVRIYAANGTGLLRLTREIDASTAAAPFSGPAFARTVRVQGERLFASAVDGTGQPCIVVTPLSIEDCDLDGTTDSCEILLGTSFDTDRNGVPDDCASTGVRYCDPAMPNSTGAPARIAYDGNAATALINENLYVEGLPVGAAGYFMASRTNGVTVNPGAWLGALCLDGGPISRRVGGLRRADPDGRARALINRGALPGQAAGQIELILPGDTWYFQYWYVDPATSPMSNFSDAVQIDFTLF